MANGYRGFSFYVFLCNLVQILLWIVHCGNCTRDMSQIDDEKWSSICPSHNMFYAIQLELFNVIQSKVFYVRSPIAITCVDFFFDQNFRFTNAIRYGYLTTIGGCWYFDRAFVLQRLKNQSLYNKILLLQKFNYTLGKAFNLCIFSL